MHPHCPLLCLIFLLSTLPSLINGRCAETASCIYRIRTLASEPRHFWFGEHRRALCGRDEAETADCWAPRSLQHFHSLGQRLFRVRTFHDAYLQNLRIYPKMSFVAGPDSYRGCDHNFNTTNTTKIEADPDMEPVAPFLTKNKPQVTWHGLLHSDEYTLALVDVGFGTLNWLVEDFPSRTKTLRDYTPSDNFRSAPNPVVLLVFKKGPRAIELVEKRDGQFELIEFMMKNELEDCLIGINVLTVGTDAFAIERQRLKGGPDNCHSLLAPSYKRSHAAPARLLSRLPMDEVAAWITVVYTQPAVNGRICCKTVRSKERPIVLDPLGYPSMSALIVASAPLVSSLISPSSMLVDESTRYTRTYVALHEDQFTFALVDAASGALHWLVVDVPSSILSADLRNGGIQKAGYLPPVPERPASCSSFVFLLMLQPSSLAALPAYCQGSLCHERNMFRVDTFKQRYNLRLRAVSWMKVCHDLPFAFHLASTQPLYGAPSVTLAKRELKAVEVCRAFDLDATSSCSSLLSLPLNSTTQPPTSLALLALMLLLRLL